MNINDSFPSSYLKASDLGKNEPVVTIDRVEHEPVGREREMKAVLYFAGKDKGIVLNKTNAKKISDLIGSTETDEWKGFRIRLFATTTEFGGETVECIRVKAAGTNGKPQAAAPPPPKPVELTDDDIPF